ncbi:MAG: hypothetical protein C4521_02990 [Actinobacteria bacterium]|nr:MAG: hypothetical protein C4521_02990 [Actinomycetota bacterium]
MNPKQRRKKILVLVALLLALLLLALGLWYFLARGQLPIPQVPPDKGINPPSYLYSITGAGGNKLLRPLGVAVGRNNLVYVTDSANSRIEVFTSPGRFLFAFNKVGKEKLLLPVYVAINGDDELFVTDRGRKKCYVFDLEGKYLRTIAGPPKPAKKSLHNWAPTAMTFDGGGNLYVTDILVQHRVLVYDKQGKLRFQFGRKGELDKPSTNPSTAGRFWFPNGITLDNRGNIFVADSNNRRLQVYDREGKFVRFLSTLGLPRGVKFYDVGELMVVDTLGHQVGIYDKKGNNLAVFGQNGTGLGEFQFPNDISIGPDKKIYVVDTYNDRVQVWGFRPEIPKALKPYIPPPWCCLVPLLLLPLLLLLRRKKYLATDDFLELIVENERLELIDGKKIIVMEQTYERFKHVEQDDMLMGEILETEDYDEADARDFMEQYQIDEYEARILSMTHRKKYLLSEDPDLRRISTALGVETLNYEEFVERFEEREEE